ncbi:MAG: hypothetical protein U0Q16_23565 [Bryobacteraceae bacterium]
MSRKKAEQILRICFGETGLVRPPSGERKGWEVRLILFSSEELEVIQQASEAIGLKAGRPWAKSNRTVLPFYGEDAMKWFTSGGATTPNSKSRR